MNEKYDLNALRSTPPFADDPEARPPRPARRDVLREQEERVGAAMTELRRREFAAGAAEDRAESVFVRADRLNERANTRLWQARALFALSVLALFLAGWTWRQ